MDRSKIEYISAVRLLIKVNARFSPSEFDFNTSLKVYVFPVPAPANIENHEQWIEVDDYINLVKRAAPIIRQEYPETKIVVGGTCSLIIEESRNYLFAILRSDIMPLVDVISWHGWSDTSTECENLRDYYYKYPSIVKEIKDVASAHGFEGEYVADELHWTPPGTTGFVEYSEIKCAKYYARGIIMHLGMDVSVSQFYIVP